MALDDYEEALKSYIHDDDKLVTYKWLSKEFEVHVNVAKDILKQYWEKHKNEEKILATFLLIGQLKDRSIRVEVVKEPNLNTAKDKFIKVDCEHLYSLQKSLDDVESLAFAGEGDLRYSSIKCNEDYIRTDEEIESLRYIGNISKEKSKPIVSNTAVKPPGKQVNNSSKGKDKFIENKKDDIKEKKEKSVEHKAKEKPETKEKSGESKSESKTKEKSKLKEKFVESKAENKSEAPPEKKVSPMNKSNNSKAKVTKKLVQSKQTGFNNLFGKASSKPQQSSKPTEDSDNDEKQNNLSDSTKHQAQVSKEKITKSSKENDNKSKDLEKEKSKYSQEKENRNEQLEKKSKNVGKSDPKISNKSKSNAKDNRGTKRNRSQEKNNALSKRKRIVIADSSEDESNKSDNEEEEEEPMEVEEESPKVVRQRSTSPPVEKRENGKRMVRKTIDKTFKDEDGYLVTKRVHVYEAASDNDESEEVKVEEPAKSKPVEVRAKKQTTLMNFFKKS